MVGLFFWCRGTRVFVVGPGITPLLMKKAWVLEWNIYVSVRSVFERRVEVDERFQTFMSTSSPVLQLCWRQ